MAWEIDPYHSLVEFSVKHLMISSVKGRFNDIHGSIMLDPEHPEYSSVKVQIQTASIDTGMAQRDAHLRSADFFDASKHPIITFASTQIKIIGQNRCIVEGNLTLHGVTNPVALQTIYTGRGPDPFTDAWRIGLHATTSFDRRQFGMEFKQDKKGVLMIGFETLINISIEAIQV
jgi:polyisoprenoid-binding protein YceI